MKRGKAHPAHQGKVLEQSPQPIQTTKYLTNFYPEEFFKRKNQREKTK